MKKVISFLMFVCLPMNMLVSMEQNRDKQKVNLILVDDNNKKYSIARWKVIQDSSQLDTLTVPVVTEQAISFFDKDLDSIDVDLIRNNNNLLNLEIKKIILLTHLSAYKPAFDYLLISMITDNIRNNRVKAEESYTFKSELGMPPIAKLNKNGFKRKIYADEPVTIHMPLSTMTCKSMKDRDKSCVIVFDKIETYGEYIGTISYPQKNIDGLGFTSDLRYLVATFDNRVVSKNEKGLAVEKYLADKMTSMAQLYSDEDYATYKEITHNIKLADIYLLLHLYKARKEGRRVELQKNEYEYVRDHVASSEKGKELIKKHFL